MKNEPEINISKRLIAMLMVGIEGEFNAIRKYIGTSSAHVGKEQKELNTKEDLIISKKYYEHESDELLNFHLSSAYIMAYSLFERKINLICSVLGKNENISLELKDIAGQGIERAKVYLSKVFKVTGPFSGQEWSRCIHHGKVRNLLVHNGGFTSSKHDNHRAAVNFCRKQEGISLVEIQLLKTETFYTVKISQEGVLLAINDYESILINVCKKLRESS